MLIILTFVLLANVSNNQLQNEIPVFIVICGHNQNSLAVVLNISQCLEFSCNIYSYIFIQGANNTRRVMTLEWLI
jgi:hypothetical protein